MKKAIFLLVALLLVFSAMPVAADNGAPNGPHYNLNIIAVKDKTAEMDGANGHVIFVSDNGVSKINLYEGPADIFDFQVLDANGTDADGAAFQLPNPDPDCDGTTWYSAYLRVLGKPGTTGTLQSCVTDATGSWCAADIDEGVNPIPLDRNKNAKFVNVSRDLLYVDVCTLVDAITGECLQSHVEPLFGPSGEAYWWETDITGKKLVQIRFYEVATPAWADTDVVCEGEPLP